VRPDRHFSRLPEPGPGRPEHPSYRGPGPTMSLLELLLFVVATAGGLVLLDVLLGLLS
jgi:hypothetical protein